MYISFSCSIIYDKIMASQCKGHRPLVLFRTCTILSYLAALFLRPTFFVRFLYPYTQFHFTLHNIFIFSSGANALANCFSISEIMNEINPEFNKEQIQTLDIFICRTRLGRDKAIEFLKGKTRLKEYKEWGVFRM